MGKEFYNMTEFARKIGATRKTVRGWIDRGELKYLKFGNTYRIPASELEVERKGE